MSRVIRPFYRVFLKSDFGVHVGSKACLLRNPLDASLPQADQLDVIGLREEIERRDLNQAVTLWP